MSGCANPRCPQHGQYHSGVGQSPEHPEDLTGGAYFFLWLFIIPVAVMVIVAIWGGK